MKRRHYIVAGLCLLVPYVVSYSVLYANRKPAANLGYFVYSLGGGAKGGQESMWYYLYFPAYKVHRLFGIGRHNLDRASVDSEGLYDGDEPK
jgi:hypothetical protein